MSLPRCSLFIVDNFYTNPMETRNFILSQPFNVKGNYPGQRTKSYATAEIRDFFQQLVGPTSGAITRFDIPGETTDDANTYNGAYQYTTSRDRSWVHIDGYNNWAAVVFLTPNAPVSSGTAFYKYCDGTANKAEMDLRGNKELIDRDSQDITKWQLVDQVANVFNRMVLFDSTRFHMSMDYFGQDKDDGRLFQVFFFSTEK